LALKNPIGLTIDLEWNLSYVRYRDRADDERLAPNKRIGETVVLNETTDAELIGIELLALDAQTLVTARAVAHARGFTFPKDIVDVTNCA